MGSSVSSAGVGVLRGGRGASRVGAQRDEVGAVVRTVQESLADIHVNVRDFGAVGDGVTDDTAAFVAAISAAASNGSVFVPAGDHRVTSTLTVSRGITIRGNNRPGNGYNASSTQRSMIRHDFDGDLFVFDGADADVQGASGGLQNLELVQAFGDGTSAAGRAVVVTGSTSLRRASWVHISDVNFEVLSGGVDDWLVGLDIDGSVVGKAAGGVRDVFVNDCRFVSGVNAVASIRCNTAFNIFLNAAFCNLANGKVIVSGPSAGESSAAIYAVNCVASWEVDHAANVNVSGGRIDNASTTANSSDVFFAPASANGIPANIPGATFLASSGGVIYAKSENATVMQVCQDEEAGDTTDTVELGVGNHGALQGGVRVQYTNAAASGAPAARFRFFPRNNADSSIFDGGYVEFTKVAGQDKSRCRIVTTAGSVDIHPDGYVSSSLPLAAPAYNSVSRPSASGLPAGAMIWNSTSREPNYAFGGSWYDSDGNVV